MLEKAKRENDSDILSRDIFDRKKQESIARDALKTELDRVNEGIKRFEAIMESDIPDFSKDMERQTSKWIFAKRDRLILDLEESNAVTDMTIAAKAERDKMAEQSAASGASPGMALPVDEPMAQAPSGSATAPSAASAASGAVAAGTLEVKLEKSPE